MKKVIFLDRDGTINIEKDYLHKVEDFEFEQGSLEALKIFNQLGYDVIVVTNQSGIARGYYSEEDLIKLNEFMIERVKEAGGDILECYFCPHHPEKGIEGYRKDCQCRKPNPGMLNEAMKKYDISKKESYMVGDKISDIEAGERAGVKSVLVKTGYGMKTLEKNSIDAPVFENLFEFAKYLLISGK
ncbi:MAG: D-glycero-beta-D-manno-heptose 1,7-bisphosphate 7-phosphatase [Fusobacteriaceae bacterium]